MADLTVTAADVRPLPGAIIQRFIASAAINVGDLVYKGATTTQVTKADANAAATAKAIGIMVSAPNGVSAAAAGDYVDVLIYGPCAGFSSLTPAAVGWVSETAGKLADAIPTTAASLPWKMGWAMSASVFFVNPANAVNPQTTIADITENSTTIGGSQDGNYATLTVGWNGSTYPSAAEGALLIDAIRENSVKINAVLALLRKQGMIPVV